MRSPAVSRVATAPDDNRIPRVLWLMWYQGLAKAPHLVRRCVESWVRMNPGWEVVLLDQDNLHDHVPAEAYPESIRTLDLTKQSNFVRLWLLDQRGGAWADATTFCVKPLDAWIHDACSSGFFAFRNPGPDRLLSTWFLASVPGCPLTAEILRAYVAFFAQCRFDNEPPWKRRVIDWLQRRLNGSTRTTRFWFSPILTRVLRIYPYHVFHYLFERLVATDPLCAAIWSETPDIPAEGPHRMQHRGLDAPLCEEVRREIDEQRFPLYKLTWKHDQSRDDPSSAFSYLLEGPRRSPAACGPTVVHPQRT